MKKPDKITSGPWKFIPHGINHTAEIHDANGCFGTVHRDNAQAIAALPKLLEALENALEEAENCEESLEGLIGLKNYILDMVPPALLAAGYTE